jgi:hypothetical protein
MDLKHQIVTTFEFNYEILLNTVKFEDLGPYISLTDRSGRDLLSYLSKQKTSHDIKFAIKLIDTYKEIFNDVTRFNRTFGYVNDVILCKLIDIMNNNNLNYKDRNGNNNLLSIIKMVDYYYNYNIDLQKETQNFGVTQTRCFGQWVTVLKYYINKFGVLTNPGNLNYYEGNILYFIMNFYKRRDDDLYYIFVNSFGILLNVHYLKMFDKHTMSLINKNILISLINCYGILCKRYIYNFRHIGFNKIILIYGRY